MCLYTTCRAVSLSLLLAAISAGSSLAQEAQIRARGQFHYQRYCAVCHGEQGTGNGPMAADLRVPPADLTQLSKKNGGQFPFWQAYRVVEGREAVRGHGTREMPLWGEELRREENAALPRLQEDLVAGRIWQLLWYVQSLQEQ